jgi:hypothetical protein
MVREIVAGGLYTIGSGGDKHHIAKVNLHRSLHWAKNSGSWLLHAEARKKARRTEELEPKFLNY